MRSMFPIVRYVDVNRCSLRTEKGFLGHICLKSGGLNEICFPYHKHLRAFNILKIWYKSPRACPHSTHRQFQDRKVALVVRRRLSMSPSFLYFLEAKHEFLFIPEYFQGFSCGEELRK